jgi:VIT1/CCC1 family predicted Fe2+/Mn2+ transporter
MSEYICELTEEQHLDGVIMVAKLIEVVNQSQHPPHGKLLALQAAMSAVMGEICGARAREKWVDILIDTTNRFLRTEGKL